MHTYKNTISCPTLKIYLYKIKSMKWFYKDALENDSNNIKYVKPHQYQIQRKKNL